jgi:IS66 C-terminal element
LKTFFEIDFYWFDWLFQIFVGFIGSSGSGCPWFPIENAKANGLKPIEYSTLLFTELPSVTSEEALEKLLPWNCGLDKIVKQ